MAGLYRLRLAFAEWAKARAWAFVQLLDLGPQTLLVPIAKWLGRERVRINIYGLGKVTLRPHDTDLETVAQVFVSRDYDIGRYPQQLRLEARYRQILDAGHTPLIIDAGANIGIASRWFLGVYPQAQILAVEPEPRNAELCRENLAGFAGAKVIEAALGGTAGAVSIKESAEGSWAVQTERSSDGVPVRTIEDLVSSAGPRHELFIVKIDIEGFEKDVFEGDTRWLDAAAAVFVEPHDWMLPGGGSSAPMQKAVCGRGWEILSLKETLVFVRV